MDGRQRVEAALALGLGDRPPVGAWGHTYREEWSVDDLAAITIERARKFGWDFVKFQPRASTFGEAFGSVFRPSGHRLRAPVLVSLGAPDADSWPAVSLANKKALDDQVESIGIVARELGPSVPVIQTVFSPLTVAAYLVGRSKSRLLRDLRRSGEVMRPALERIADGLIDFSRSSVEAGAAGIFYAISGYASKDFLPEPAYREMVLPLDMYVLGRLPKESWFNVVHLCGSHVHFDLSREMPVGAVSWSVHNQGNPSLAEGRQISGKAVMGGLGQRTTLIYGPPASVESEARRAIGETGGRGLILAPGCSVPPRARDANLAAMVAGIAA